MGAESPWMTLAEAAAYVKRGKRFLVREVQAGRLRAARVGGRGEILTCQAWLDSWVESLTAQVVPLRRRA